MTEPTCWYCPKCGYICDRQIDIHESKIDHHAWCREAMIECLIVVPRGEVTDG